MQKRCSNKSGFTLAEVLVTLVVIGVVASISIPTLLQNIQEQDLRTKWKAAYAIVEQANKRALMDYGGDFTGIFQNYTDMKNKMKGYFSYIKECEGGQSEGNCWPAEFYRKDGTSTGLTDVAALVLNNGMAIRFYMSISATANATSCTETDYYTTGECGMYELDMNGVKGPNKFGEDIQFIHILSDKLKPAGVSKSVYNDCSSMGLGCGARYLRQ